MSDSESHPSILVVDDEETNIDLLVHALSDRYDVSVAMEGATALELVGEMRPDLVLLDIVMPGMDGFEVCQRLKTDADTREIPVVFITARASREDVLRGLSLGALHYVTKPFDHESLLAIIASVVADHAAHRSLREALRRSQDTLSLLLEGRFRFRTLQEARDLALLLARICRQAEGCLLGLTELMINAVEHGNLGITYQEKSRLQQEGRWHEEVEHRLQQPAYLHKNAFLQVTRADDEVHFLIEDQGKGFDWQPYLEFSPERAFDSHGRGIAMSRITGFQRVTYQGNGNRVLAVAQSG